MTVTLSSLGWDDHFRRAYARLNTPDHWPGRVARVDRGICCVLAADGMHRVSLGGPLLAAAAADPVRLPCTGDWVAARGWPDGRTTLEAVLPRRTVLVRAGAGAARTPQVLAANVDVVGVVASVDPEPDLGRIERLLALAWESGAKPVVILTKVDLAADPDAIASEVSTVAPGVSVYPVSATTGKGLARVRALVRPGRTLGLVGASGTGKSTLVNALVGTTVMSTRSIRIDGRGRHTTTYRALVPLPQGGAVLDTPGLRGVGLLDGIAGLERAFADVQRLSRACRFADCLHRDEPGCAVLAAVASGKLSQRRLESWHTLRREVHHDIRDSRVSDFPEERRPGCSRRARLRNHHEATSTTRPLPGPTGS